MRTVDTVYIKGLNGRIEVGVDDSLNNVVIVIMTIIVEIVEYNDSNLLASGW